MPQRKSDNKLLDPFFDCRCLDATTIFDLRQALNIAKEKYQDKAKYLLSRGRTTDSARYHNKLRRTDSIINRLKDVKVCSEM